MERCVGFVESFLKWSYLYKKRGRTKSMTVPLFRYSTMNSLFSMAFRTPCVILQKLKILFFDFSNEVTHFLIVVISVYNDHCVSFIHIHFSNKLILKIQSLQKTLLNFSTFYNESQWKTTKVHINFIRLGAGGRLVFIRDRFAISHKHSQTCWNTGSWRAFDPPNYTQIIPFF